MDMVGAHRRSIPHIPVNKIGTQAFTCVPILYAGRGNRTPTPLLAPDFESSASTSSTIPASYH